MKFSSFKKDQLLMENWRSFLKEHDDDPWYKEGDPDKLDDTRAEIEARRIKYYPAPGDPGYEESFDPDHGAETSYDEQMVNDLLNQIGSLLGHDMPDVVGLEAEQLAGAVSDAIDRWNKKQQLSPTGKSNAGTGLPRDPKTSEPVEVEFPWE